jgi:hypothetical protein
MASRFGWSTSDSDSVPYAPVTVVGASAPLFQERLRIGGRGWLWLPPVLAITFLAVAPIIVPIALVAWFVNIARFWRTTVRIDDEHVWVGRRSVRLVALDLTTLGRAQNTWPWRTFSRRWLGGNPIWTSDSVGVRGFDDGKPWWVSVGTNRREELVGVLERAVRAARKRTPAPVLVRTAPPGWHPDPWDPVNRLRWWDGTQWTGWTHPPSSAQPVGSAP